MTCIKSVKTKPKRGMSQWGTIKEVVYDTLQTFHCKMTKTMWHFQAEASGAGLKTQEMLLGFFIWRLIYCQRKKKVAKMEWLASKQKHLDAIQTTGWGRWVRSRGWRGFFLWGASAELGKWHKVLRREALQVSRQQSKECCCFTWLTQSREGGNQQWDWPWRLLMESIIWTCAASLLPRLHRLLWFTPSSRWAAVFSAKINAKTKQKVFKRETCAGQKHICMCVYSSCAST